MVTGLAVVRACTVPAAPERATTEARRRKTRLLNEMRIMPLLCVHDRMFSRPTDRRYRAVRRGTREGDLTLPRLKPVGFLVPRAALHTTVSGRAQRAVLRTSPGVTFRAAPPIA